MTFRPTSVLHFPMHAWRDLVCCVQEKLLSSVRIQRGSLTPVKQGVGCGAVAVELDAKVDLLLFKASHKQPRDCKEQDQRPIGVPGR